MSNLICLKNNEVKYNFDVMKAFGLHYNDFEGLKIKNEFWNDSNKIILFKNNIKIVNIDFKLAFKNAKWFCIVNTNDYDLFKKIKPILYDFLNATHLTGQFVNNFDGEGIYIYFIIDYNNNFKIWKYLKNKIVIPLQEVYYDNKK